MRIRTTVVVASVLASLAACATERPDRCERMASKFIELANRAQPGAIGEEQLDRYAEECRDMDISAQQELCVAAARDLWDLEECGVRRRAPVASATDRPAPTPPRPRWEVSR